MTESMSRAQLKKHQESLEDEAVIGANKDVVQCQVAILSSLDFVRRNTF
jgi:hypothetical protein